MADLSTVKSRDSARRFAREGAKLVRREERRVPEFYVAEFLSIFKRTLVVRFTAETDGLQQAIDHAQMEASVATVELTARLEAASAVDDHDAQHAVWKEREVREQIAQEKIDATRALTQLLPIRLDAFKRLASTLGATFS